jgi:hypothetical protein
MASFSSLKRILPLVVGVGCGGEVGIGTLLANSNGTDGGASGSSTPPGPTTSAPTSTSSTPGKDASTPSVPPVNCGPSIPGSQGVYDLAASGDNEIHGFFGDGQKVYAGVNVIANFVAGRVFALTPSSKDPVVDISPVYVHGLSRALGRVYYGVDMSGTGALGTVVTATGAKEQVDTQGVPTFASHPARSEAFFAISGSGSTQDVVKRWAPPAAPTNEIVLPNHLRVRSLAVAPNDVIALVQDTAAFNPLHVVIHPNPLAGGGPYQELAFINGETISNIVVDPSDATHGFVAVYDTSGTKAAFVIHRVSLVPSAVMPTPERIAQITPTSTYGVQIEVDATHVYVAMVGVPPTCTGLPCPQPVTVKRVAKSATPATAVIENVNAFEGASGHRTFNVDDCYYYWYDAGQNVLFRQSKGSL